MVDKQATRDAYGQALVELGHMYEDIIVMDADLSKSTKTADFAKVFPGRFFNAGIAEQNLMGMAAGLSTCGKVVFASTFAIFATGRAYEIVRNSLAYGKLNVKVCATHAGLTVGEDGGSHQSVEDIALMRSVPNMKVVVPADGVSTRQALFKIYEQEGPFYLRLGRPAVPVIYDQSLELEIGRGIELKNGPDATLIACGLMVAPCLEAARLLEEQGIKVSVIDMHTIKPLDVDLVVRKARETGAILTAEEHSIIGGLGSAVCEAVCQAFPVPVCRLGINDVFGQSGTPDQLLQHYGLNIENIVKNVNKIMEMKRL
ncbi:MAG TPA: transketolase family protein [Syntrophomonadaceae bacterium]|nr:transketolase family protein [Syntrophomonadaceae bacterium]